MFKTIRRLKFMLKFWRFFPFLKEFYLSQDVQLFHKVLGVLMVLIYIIFPFDLIPDFLSFFGFIDDVVIVTFIFERIVKMAPQSLKEKYELFERK